MAPPQPQSEGGAGVPLQPQPGSWGGGPGRRQAVPAANSSAVMA